MTSSFGYRIHPILGYRKLHTGTDFGGPCGTPVKAAADGQVVSAGWGGGYGNLVVITHGNVGGSSLATAYAHLSSFEVTDGPVSRGQVIGYIGTTGSSTGCHLHFETRVAGTPVDPLHYL
jgi:murein DD-endopeptidase MepM/ murein hydrolase activator NlpD